MFKSKKLFFRQLLLVAFAPKGVSSSVVECLLIRWDSLSYFKFRPVFQDWFIKGYGMLHIKDHLLLTDEQPMWWQLGFLAEWSFYHTFDTI